MGRLNETTIVEPIVTLLNMKDIARLMGVSWVTIKRMSKKDTFPKGFKLGARTVWKKDVIENFIKTL